jgi:GTP cyclohydrolase II
MFQAKMYKHNQREYLVILSNNFFECSAPIFYIHSDEHECNSLDEFCGCSYPISVAMKMIYQAGGLILYSSHDLKNIDAFLREINVRKMHSENQVMVDTNFKSALKGYRGEYLTIDFILKNLNISNVQLVSDNPNIIFIMQQSEINILKHTPSISFKYGDNQALKTNGTIEAAKAISFEYDR